MYTPDDLTKESYSIHELSALLCIPYIDARDLAVFASINQRNSPLIYRTELMAFLRTDNGLRWWRLNV